MELNEREFSSYTKAYARRMFKRFKNADGSSGDQRTYDRAAKHLKSKFPEKSGKEIHSELNKHYNAMFGESDDGGPDLYTPPTQTKGPEHKTKSTGVVGKLFRELLMMRNRRKATKMNTESIFSETRKETFLESLQESMLVHKAMRDRAEKLAEHLGISVGEAIQQLKAHLVFKLHKESLDNLTEGVLSGEYYPSALLEYSARMLEEVVLTEGASAGTAFRVAKLHTAGNALHSAMENAKRAGCVTPEHFAANEDVRRAVLAHREASEALTKHLLKPNQNNIEPQTKTANG